jgi:Zn-dependent peptidase ImmA (M78 family)
MTISSYQKGEKLEGQIYDLFKNMIDKDDFPFKKDNCKIFSQKGYYSKDRESDIKFDVSIEIYFPGQDRYSFLFLIECKNYNHKVPVDDVEEFFTKAQQISGANIKAVVASTNSFQDGALKFAKSKGIGLLRYYNPSELRWELARSPSSFVSTSYSINEWSIARKGIIDQDYKSQYFDCYGYVNDEYTNSLYVLFLSIIKEGADNNISKQITKIKNKDKSKKILIPYKSKLELENFCHEIHKDIVHESEELTFDCLSSWLFDKHGIETINTSSLDGKTLGNINFNTKKIYINSNDSSHIGRNKFTLCHEIGHYLLGHGDYMIGERCLDEDLNIEEPPQIMIKDIMKMEYQANYFASCLLIPKISLSQQFLSIASNLELYDKGYGILYVDNQQCNQDTYYRVTGELMRVYGVSRIAIKIRLKELGFLKEPSNA